MKRTCISFIGLCMILAGTQLSAQKAAEKKAPEKKPVATAKNLPDGYGGVKWGTTLGAAKSGVTGKITYSDDKRRITTRDGDLEYLYGFFYREIPTKTAEDKAGTETAPAAEGRLFYVLVQFPYLAFEDVKKKLTDQYGSPTGEVLKDNQGALIWDGDKTSIVLWVDQYEKKPFSRKITYVAKEIVKELNEYQKEIFSSAEMEVLKKLAP